MTINPDITEEEFIAAIIQVAEALKLTIPPGSQAIYLYWDKRIYGHRLCEPLDRYFIGVKMYNDFFQNIDRIQKESGQEYFLDEHGHEQVQLLIKQRDEARKKLIDEIKKHTTNVNE